MDHHTLTPVEEDCLVTINTIEKEEKVARVSEIARRLNVSLVTVSTMVKRLTTLRLTDHESYGYVHLTSLGLKRAGDVLKKREAITLFFQCILGMNSEEVDDEACELEHSLSLETERRLRKLMEFISSSPETNSQWVKAFQKFLSHEV
jgi:DtxR family transcriptional regulator, Mn-dependent transcriptional regulator